MAKLYTSFMCAMLTILGSVVSTEEEMNNKTEDPKKSLESLGSFFKLMSGNEKGCKISCPQGSVPLPRPSHVPTSNGCGSLGIKLDTSMFPGFEQCCDTHDKCYDTCNEDRDKCDKDFQDCLYNVCDEISKFLPSDQVQLCENSGGVMHAAAVGLGCTAFTKAQNNACVCSGQAIEEGGGSSKHKETTDEKNEL